MVITDALNMGGITAYGSTGSIAVRALRSGVDLLLMPPQPAVAIQAVAAAVRRGTISEGRLNTSVRRVLELKQQLGLFRSAKRLPPAADGAQATSLRRAGRDLFVILLGRGRQDL